MLSPIPATAVCWPPLGSMVEGPQGGSLHRERWLGQGWGVAVSFTL